jgi:flagellar motor switch protein FliN/FliY
MADQNEQENAGEPSGTDSSDAAYEIPVEVIAVLGTAELQVSQILKLGRGAVVELDRTVGEPIEVHANNQLIARGEVVVIEDRLGVQMIEIIKSASN